MNHAITIGGLVRAAFVLVGLLALGGGVLQFLAGSMSDAPQAGDDAGRIGCGAAVSGIVLIIGALVI
jgi:hypothetical protein